MITEQSYAKDNLLAVRCELEMRTRQLQSAIMARQNELTGIFAAIRIIEVQLDRVDKAQKVREDSSKGAQPATYEKLMKDAQPHPSEYSQHETGRR